MLSFPIPLHHMRPENRADCIWQPCWAQLHPAKADYVNQHPNCLHLWKPTTDTIPLPPSIMVGYKTA
jgi:hypothetical protein